MKRVPAFSVESHSGIENDEPCASCGEGEDDPTLAEVLVDNNALCRSCALEEMGF